MSRSTKLFSGLFASFAVSCVALVLTPQSQLGGLQPQFTEEDGKITDVYPIDVGGIAQQGREVYINQGCISCHSQQVRNPQYGTDIERGWGPRRTVARDYLYATPALLGSQRVGPDLANVGWADWRNEAKTDTRRPVRRDATWHLLHLYNPTAVIPESNHPPYRYLFETRKISGQRSADALNVTGELLPEPGYEVVPTAAARSLVGYLLSLDRSHELKEANGVPAATAAAPAAPASTPAAQ
ncbi:cbb3-type cytochrome c oxidase subunit II [Verrucomicrobiota bacterium sgz303538]